MVEQFDSRVGERMALSTKSFLGSLGFVENPFDWTNADEEPHLSSYFVPPPYFASVIGSPSKPKSVIVFAPRGGGKTAQKVMIENEAHLASDDPSTRFLCISYDDFDTVGFSSVDQATDMWHLTNIFRKIITALIIEIDDNKESSKNLTKEQKNWVANKGSAFLSEITEAEFRQTLNSIRNWQGKTEHIWQKYGGKISMLLSSVAEFLKAGKIEKLAEKVEKNPFSIVEYIKESQKISSILGFKSIYILVDRIDEANITKKGAKDAFDFISPILTNLHLLEIPGLCFKFFLWDKMKVHYEEAGGRPDRIVIHEIEWSFDQISLMLSKRLASFSDENIKNLNEMFSSEVVLDFHSMISRFSGGSPRDMIRMCHRICAEKTKMENEISLIDFRAAVAGILKFSEERSREVYGPAVDQIMRFGKTRFNKADLESFFDSDIVDDSNGNDVVSERAIRKWRDRGVITSATVDEYQMDDNDSSLLPTYYLSDPKLVLVAKKNHSRFLLTLKECFLICSSCSTLGITDQGYDIIHCRSCGKVVPKEDNFLVSL